MDPILLVSANELQKPPNILLLFNCYTFCVFNKIKKNTLEHLRRIDIILM